MAFNYFIAYDLVSPGQNYDAVITRIESLGVTAHIQQSLFYLQSKCSMTDVNSLIRDVMDPNDKLAVIWARDAFVSNYRIDHLEMLSAAFKQAA